LAKLTNTHVSIIKRLIWLRLSQLLVNERYKNGDFKIPIHLALGHESLAVAVDESMKIEDHLLLSHRNIHYNLAKEGALKEELAEYYLSDFGLANGHLGSMNLANPKKNIVYTSSILANNLAVATGYALGNKANAKDGLVFVVTGDGAIEEGTMWESLLFMKSNDLKVIIIVENNQWSLGSKINERRCEIDLEQLATALKVNYVKLQGNDPFEYIESIRALTQQCANKSCPVIMEVELTTLGYWYMKTDEYSNGKFINYHAGPATKVVLNDYPLISESAEDPLYLLKSYLSDDELIDISLKLLKNIKLELI
jgi:TPP-dependent pyruvate/acetoin dehydrogenase alpha subunit